MKSLQMNEAAMKFNIYLYKKHYNIKYASVWVILAYKL